ncbi:MAG: hypothetical protein C4290_10865, partial [Chloroflexota bacterium]
MIRCSARTATAVRSTCRWGAAMRRDAEAWFVRVATCEPPAVDGHRVRAAATVRDWLRLVALAERHGVLAFVQRALHDVPLVPDTVHRALQEGLTAVVLRQALLGDVLRRVLDVLGAAGVPVIVLKGPVLARTLYPSA